jgi:hypothetical protein
VRPANQRIAALEAKLAPKAAEAEASAAAGYMGMPGMGGTGMLQLTNEAYVPPPTMVRSGWCTRARSSAQVHDLTAPSLLPSLPLQGGMGGAPGGVPGYGGFGAPPQPGFGAPAGYGGAPAMPPYGAPGFGAPAGFAPPPFGGGMMPPPPGY